MPLDTEIVPAITHTRFFTDVIHHARNAVRSDASRGARGERFQKAVEHELVTRYGFVEIAQQLHNNGHQLDDFAIRKGPEDFVISASRGKQSFSHPLNLKLTAEGYGVADLCSLNRLVAALFGQGDTQHVLTQVLLGKRRYRGEYWVWKVSKDSTHTLAISRLGHGAQGGAPVRISRSRPGSVLFNTSSQPLDTRRRGADIALDLLNTAVPNFHGFVLRRLIDGGVSPAHAADLAGSVDVVDLIDTHLRQRTQSYNPPAGDN